MPGIDRMRRGAEPSACAVHRFVHRTNAKPPTGYRLLGHSVSSTPGRRRATRGVERGERGAAPARGGGPRGAGRAPCRARRRPGASRPARSPARRCPAASAADADPRGRDRGRPRDHQVAASRCAAGPHLLGRRASRSPRPRRRRGGLRPRRRAGRRSSSRPGLRGAGHVDDLGGAALLERRHDHARPVGRSEPRGVADDTAPAIPGCRKHWYGYTPSAERRRERLVGAMLPSLLHAYAEPKRSRVGSRRGSRT